ncbi:callose synthase 10 isoform X1 [Vigna radiata var. radiata]|uniref:1,3-beta-glucan synthase n=1 Tax=Vigna radiata var. radiata TaxID=3916 RepID=A0A1S3U4I8_VIGRR|nr:callose synthase 10 isoform X1 [Vigna radiata var. radiata]
MVRARENWEKLVRATLKREQLRNAGQGHARVPSGIAGAVPPSLAETTNIDLILQAADEIQSEDPNVARILCEQAYSMAQNLDPNSHGRGVLQFKTGLTSVIKQKLAKKDGVRIDRNRDLENLWKFYLHYKQRHRVDDIQREEQRLQESGTFSSSLGELKLRSSEMRKIIATLRALVEVLEALSKDADPNGVGGLVVEELRKLKKSSVTLSGELTPYNIIPLEAPSLTNPIRIFPEVKAAISAIRYTDQLPRLPAGFKISGQRDADLFDLLEFVFGFQKDNVRNQRENVILMIANKQSRLGIPAETDPKIDEKTINEVFLKVLDNYIRWCRYLRIRLAWNSLEAINRDRKLSLVSLYFLIWGEAANVRFLPECICFIFHNMAKELDAILDHPEAAPAVSCVTDDGSAKFLEKIICPIYDTLAAEASRNNNGKAAHSAWRNYDDFNEYFWSPACFELNWPMRPDSPFLRKPTPSKRSKRTGKSSFVEHRTFLHLYRSFHRLWIFLALMFQALTIIAFNHGHIDVDTFKKILSIGPSFAIMNFSKSFLDVLLTFGAYTTARGMAVSRLVIRFFWGGLTSVAVTYLYLKVLQERNSRNTDNSFYFRIYLLVLGVYAAVRLCFALLLKFPACHALSEMSDQSFFQFFKWIYQERYYVGRGLYEGISDYCRYVAFWLVVLACKFTFAYFLQIKPLVEPTNIIVDLPSLTYSWHDFISKNNNNALTIVSLWAPVVAIYLMDILIFYTVMSAIVGGVIGARARLGEIRSIEMVHKRFESFPGAFVKNLVSPQIKRIPLSGQSTQDSQDLNKTYAAMFAPFWNEIIKSLREEDFISNREMDLLSMPSNAGSLRLVQWPLFLLSSKILLAIDLALDCKDTQADLWNRISRDEYMAYAVKECYYSVEKILYSLVGNDNEGRLWVERIFREINNSIVEGSLVLTLSLKKLPVVLSRLTALSGLLIRNDPELAKGAAKAVHDLYEVVTHELVSSDLRENLDTWNLLARARDERRLFSRIIWPNDPEIKELVKRLHLLLTVKDSAANIPKNLEARRRLEFFTNSLFMDMPSAKPVSEMLPFSVFTPYYSETVLYGTSELQKENEDGISTLFYLQKIFPDEWENFLERIGRGASTGDAELQESSSDALELRFWASYRGQTLARTVRGMMYYRRALMLQSFLESRSLGVDNYPQNNFITSQDFELSRESRAQADLKFTYVVSCQIYGLQKQRKAAEAADIALLLQRNEALRVAFIHSDEPSDANSSKVFYSKLVKADINGKDQEIYSIKLPGDPKLGEGKPENQNHAIIFTRGEAVQTIDMNQDNYLEEAMKMRNLLEEFHANHGLRPPSILGVREHVFTGSVSSLAWFMSNQETSFVTLAQRVLANPLKVRMHYGHPDVFDRIFHITRGGISKASRVINISEDIYAGFNSTLRLGNITHHEYIQVGKGRDVGLNQIALFEGKVAGGNGEQVLSRDIYRLGQLFDFFRMLSFFFTTVGYYVCTMMTVLTVYVFLYGRAYLAFSGLDEAVSDKAKLAGNTALDAALNAQFLVQIGVFTAVPMIMGFILELGLLKAIFSFITMQLQLCSVFFTFSLGTRTHYFGRTILHGGAKYRATGRGFVVRHIKFAENYRLYSRSHFVKALEVALLLIVYIAYGYAEGGAVTYVLVTLSSWFLVISWLFAPYIFNPSGFEWQKTVEDFDDWTSWLLYKGGVGVKGENSWESWWDEEQMHIQTLRGRILETILSARFFLFQYGIVYKLHLTGKDTSLAVYGFSWAVLVGIVLIFKIFTYSPKKSADFQLVLRFSQGVVSIGLVTAVCLVVAFTRLSIADLFASILAFIPTGWGILSVAIAWRKIVWSLGLWDSVREFARMYDAGMGVIIFAPIAFLSWFPFISTFQSRLLFNQAFSRGLEISLILAGNKANVEA